MKTTFSITLLTFVAAFHPTNALTVIKREFEAGADVAAFESPPMHIDQNHRMALGVVQRKFEVLEEHVKTEAARELYKKNAALTDHEHRMAFEGTRGLYKKNEVFSDEEHRMAVRYTLSFDECTGQTVEYCEAIIDEMLENDPALFRGLDHLHYEVEMLQQPGVTSDVSRHLVGLVTNMAGTHVAGFSGDGIIKYYNPNYNRENVWCTYDTACPDEPNHLQWIEDKCCFAIGPWDCDTGTPKTVDQCCEMIKASVPLPDTDGNDITCFPSHPLGSHEHPVDYTRVVILTDGNGMVIGEPTNE